MGGDGGRDALAAAEAGAQQLVGVGAVPLGAGRADRGSAVPARLVEHPVGQVAGVKQRPQFAGGWVRQVRGTAEPDRRVQPPAPAAWAIQCR